jgi:hypothetical protein
VGAIAARATALYFRYGGTTTTAVSGVQILNTMNSLRWSGLVAREALPSLTTLASNTARDYTRARVSTYGLLARARQNSSGRSPRIVTTPSGDVQERLLDRLDPAHQFERLSRFLLRTRRLAALRGDWMYFYTRLDQGEGLVGVNVNTGIDERSIRLPPPDERFLTDEITQLLYMSRGDRLHAFRLTDREW